MKFKKDDVLFNEFFVDYSDLHRTLFYGLSDTPLFIKVVRYLGKKNRTTRSHYYWSGDTYFIRAWDSRKGKWSQKVNHFDANLVERKYRAVDRLTAIIFGVKI